MATWLQHLLVLTLVAVCVAAVGRQLIGTFRMRRGAKLGSCCAKGCESQPKPAEETPQRLVFIPSSSLGSKK